MKRAEHRERWSKRVVGRSLVALSLLVVLSCRGSALDVGSDTPSPEVTIAAWTPPDDALARCPPRVPETSQSFSTDDSMERSLLGRWTRCRGNGPGILFPPGIELAEDNEWFSLVHDDAGGLVRMTDDAHSGAWLAQPPLTVTVVFQNHAQQVLVVLVDQASEHLFVARSTFDAVDVVYERAR